MSVFMCQRCDNLRDSDDGCREYDGGKGTPDGAYRSFGLVCSRVRWTRRRTDEGLGSS